MSGPGPTQPWGLAVLSAGGGSYPCLEALVTRQVFRSRGGAGIPLIAIGSLPPDARVVMVAMVGAPLVMTERLANVAQCSGAVTRLQACLGVTPFDAVGGFEIGRMNCVVPVMLAAQLGLRMVNVGTVGVRSRKCRCPAFRWPASRWAR